MIANGKSRGYGLVLGLLFLVFLNKNQKRDLMRPLSKHWLKLAWPKSLNPYQGQCIKLGQETHLRQIITHRHQKIRLK